MCKQHRPVPKEIVLAQLTAAPTAAVQVLEAITHQAYKAAARGALPLPLSITLCYAIRTKPLILVSEPRTVPVFPPMLRTAAVVHPAAARHVTHEGASIIMLQPGSDSGSPGLR